LRSWNNLKAWQFSECATEEDKMVEYRDNVEPVYVKKSNAGMIVGSIVVLAIIIVGILFATGFWSADVKGGALPKVNVSAKGGDMPDVTMHSKEVVVGTSKQMVTIPKVETKTTTIDVPVVGVKDSK
jgi:pseudouridine-5'-phosphate glycosidase